MARTSLLLIRHAHTSCNGGAARPRMSGWADSPLSERGHAQALALRVRLSGGPPFAAIYTSPLLRARQTALVLVAAGLGALHECAGLKEINCGEVDGVLIDEVRQRHPALWEENLRQLNDDFRWPGGESYAELRTRTLATLSGLARTHAGARVALVTHAGFISQAVGALHGRPAARWEDFRPENASLTELEHEHGEFRLASFDDHAHVRASTLAATR
jgi:broad specificity phosphatase PhoE